MLIRSIQAVWIGVLVGWLSCQSSIRAVADESVRGQHWAFRPLAQMGVPQVTQGDRVRNEIDAFVVQALESKGLAIAADADRHALVRRVFFDLIGLPPSPDPEGYNTSGTLLWQNGWLPAVHRGTEVATAGAPVLNLQPATPVPDALRRDQLQLLAQLNREYLDKYPLESDLEARIINYELAARMQLAAGDLLDLSKETAETKRLYGLEYPESAGYGTRCLMARRLVERGVRFVQIFPPVKPQNQPWDAHRNTKTENEAICKKCDQPSGALIQDLRQRGLLESTIVIWSGEFGRLPVSQNGLGRDHNRHAFSAILAGGGFKPGHIHGATDDVGYRSVENRVSVPDLHATLLHQLGIEHNRLTYSHHGSDETLTDARVTEAHIVREILS